MELKVEYLPVSSLKEYENNARKHGEEDIGAIVASIREFGFDDPIGIWKDNIIIEGHGRLMAAKQLGMETVPCIRLDHLTDEQRRAYALAHNRTAELSGWDFLVRDEELANIAEIDMTAFGFEEISPYDFGDDFTLPDGDKPEICQMTFTLHEEQKNEIEKALDAVDGKCIDTFGNTNKNGNNLYEVVREWAEQRK